MSALHPGLTQQLSALCVEHGLNCIGLTFYPGHGSCASFVVAHIEADGECVMTTLPDAEAAVGAALAKVSADRLRSEAVSQLAILDAGAMQVAAV
jgi:hypothetical protein